MDVNLKRRHITAKQKMSFVNEGAVRIGELEPYMEQRTGSKLGKKYVKAVSCHLVYLT